MSDEKVPTHPSEARRLRVRAAVQRRPGRAPPRVDTGANTTSPSGRASSGGAADQVTAIDEDLGLSGATTQGARRLRAHDRAGRSPPRRHPPRPGGLAAGPQQRRLVPVARSVRHDRHSDRRCRRRVPSERLQRQARARAEGDDVGSRAAHSAGAPRRRESATRRRGESSAAGCRSGSSGASATARSSCIPTSRSPAPFAPSSSGSPSSGRCAGSGLWFRAEKLTFPLRLNYGAIRWVPPSYHAIHQVLTNPAYAGAYTFGKSRQERHVDENGVVRKRVRQLPRAEWPVLITEHHPGLYRLAPPMKRTSSASPATRGHGRMRRAGL